MDSKVAQPTITTVVVCCATCWKGVCCGTGCCGPICCVVQLRMDPSKSHEPCGGKSDCCSTKCEPNAGVELSISPTHDPPTTADASTTTVTVSIKGVTCADCALMIEDTLKKSTGIVRVRVSPITTQGEVIFEHGRITEKEVLSKISSLGYEPTLLSSSTGHSDTKASASVLRLSLKHDLKPVVEQQLREKLNGHSGFVDMKVQSPNTVAIRYDPAQTGPRSFVAVFSSMGVTASVSPAGSTVSTEADETTRAWKRRFWQSLVLCAPVIIVAYILPSIGGNASSAADEFAEGLSPATLVAWICATPIQFWTCWPLYVSAYKAARYGGSVNMDTLVVLSTSVAYGYSMIATLSALAGSKFSTEVFFETSAILITLIMLGRTLEVMAKGKASQVLMRIMELQATTAVLMVPPDTVLAPCCTGKAGVIACTSKTDSTTTLHNVTKKDAAKEPCSKPCTDGCGDQKSPGSCSSAKKGDCCDLLVCGASQKNGCGGEEAEISKMKEHPIDANLIHRGDILKVLPGTKVPTDGVVLLGATTIDEAMVTGESVPVSKKVGDVVYGSTVNQNGTFYLRVTKTIQENTLSAISKLVQDAQTSKAPVQRIADKIATYLVPGVIVVSVATLFVWYGIGNAGRVDTDGVHPFTFALRFGLATLVVSCPCAVGLAVPTAIMSATGVGAKLGILFKDGGVIEACHKVRAIVFDKTGTLTRGKPEVVASKVYAGNDKELTESKFWFYMGSAESGSEHIIGKAVATHARVHALEPLCAPVDYVAVPGKGLKCSVAKRSVLIGTDLWMRENNVDLSAAMLQDLERFQAQAYTVIWVAVDGVAVGLVALHDQLKPESKAVVSQLKAMGIDVWMMSGDNSHTASIVADLVGIAKDRVLGRVLPGDKAGKVKALQTNGTPVAMVGDGVNDSPALAQADVGIAVASGTDMALEAARVILLKNDLRDVLVAVDLSRRTFVRIKWNFVWAFTYNLIAMMLATGMLYPVGHVYIPPALAGVSEVVSSVPVVLFSLLLQAYTPPPSIKSQ